MWRWRIGARTRDAPVAWPMGSVYPLIEGEPKVTDPEGERIFHGHNTGPLISWETVRRWHAWCVEHHTRAYPHTFATEPEQFLTCDHVSQPSSKVLWGLPGTDLARAIAWYYDQEEPSKRRLGFPSWSWAGWVASPGNGIRFREMPARHSLFEPTYHRFLDKGWKALESPDSSPWGIGEKGTELKYDIPHHPGGSKYTKRELPPFEYWPSTMPPLSHLLRFWTSSAMLEISPTPISTDYGQHQHNVSLPGRRDRLTWIILDADWVAQNPGPGEFIVISPGVELLGEKLIDDVDVGLNLLLVERRFEVAYRLQLCGSLVEPKLWKKAMACWKDVTLG